MTAVREERRLVTCLFVDVVGSTELTMRFGAERLKRELEKAFGEISRAIVLHGGTVEKYVGDAIYALFGAPIAHEDDPLRALRAAEAVRDWCAAGAAHGHPFSVRIGVETGEAVIDLAAAEQTKQQMSVGPVVNIAARLQSRAEPGEILIGPTIRGATEGCAELEALGPAELKGVGRLPVWRLVRVVDATRPALPFIGRGAEIALLGYAYERAQKGRSVLAVVSGPPGQGKTRLVQEFLALRPDGALVILTRCRPADEVGVFAPVREILGIATLDELAERVGRMCADDAECERVVAGLAESAGIAASRSLASLPAAEREDEIVQAWRRYVAMLGADRLVILAIDDIHWADASLVRLVDRITFGGPRVLVIATARPEFADAAGIRPSGDRFFIELGGLEPEEAHQLALIAGRGDDTVVSRADGNPLFLVELARTQSGAEDLPLTLQGALGARLDQLPSDERILLSVVAVAGERFTAADAAFLGGLDLVEAGRRLGRLADLHFLDLSEKGYRFHHGLVRDVAYGRLLTAERMRAHARFARERAHPEDAEALAYHWWAALRPPDGEWVWADDPTFPEMRREAFRATLAAARRHADHFATDQAVELGDRALQLASDDLERAAAHRVLATAYRGQMRQDEVWTHLHTARDLYRGHGVVPLEIYVALAEAIVYYGAFKVLPADEEVRALFAEATGAARADPTALAGIQLSRARFVANSNPEDRAAIGRAVDEAIAVAETAGDPAVWRRALGLKAARLVGDGRFDELAPVIEELARTAVETDGLERLWDAMRVAVYHLAMATLPEAEAAVAAAVAASEPMGPHNRTHAWAQASELSVARGDWDKVVALAERTAKLMREEKGSAFCTLAGAILHDGAIALALAGRREEAVELVNLIDDTTERDTSIRKGVPLALLGLGARHRDEAAAVRLPWPDSVERCFEAVIRREPDAAERAVEGLGTAGQTAVAYRALAEAVREAISEMRGGPLATYDALRRIGYLGWIQVLERRVPPLS